jgi:PleD family two-component response regulator
LRGRTSSIVLSFARVVPVKCLDTAFSRKGYRNEAFCRRKEQMKTSLTADDSQSIRQMIAWTLSGTDYTVVQAVEGVDGLAKARTANADLVLTDQNMPNADGLTLIGNPFDPVTLLGVVKKVVR